jgi:hypothetical protein
MGADEGIMPGHGQKLTQKQEMLIAALLVQPTRAQAAKATGVAESTVGRWMRDEVFKQAYAAARQQALQDVIALLQQRFPVTS